MNLAQFGKPSDQFCGLIGSRPRECVAENGERTGFLSAIRKSDECRLLRLEEIEAEATYKAGQVCAMFEQFSEP